MKLIQVDVKNNTNGDKALLKRFGQFGPPGIAFFAPGPNLEVRRMVGFQKAKDFAKVSDRQLHGQALTFAITSGLSKADELIASAATNAHLRQAMQRLHNLLLNLEVGWNATGMWSPLMSTLNADESLEADLLQDEIDYRLGTLQRECVLLAESMSERDAAKLNPLIQCLGVDH